MASFFLFHLLNKLVYITLSYIVKEGSITIEIRYYNLEMILSVILKLSLLNIFTRTLYSLLADHELF